MKREKLNRWVAIAGIIVNVVLLIVTLILKYKIPVHTELTAYQIRVLILSLLISVVGIYLAFCLIDNEISLKLYLIIAITLLIKIAIEFYARFC